jgi:prolyl oligopeptidase PreP (S9A serine peptidase family)
VGAQATTTGRPVLLRVNETGGHASQAVPEEQLRVLLADEWTFAMWAAHLPAYHAPSNERH